MKTDSPSSIYAVAHRAGVSIVTVSRVFNNYPHVSTRMRERVLSAAREVGYTPKLVAKPRILAVVVGHLDQLNAGDYKSRLVMSLIESAAEKGYLVEFIPTHAIDLATQHLVDGVLELGLTSRELAVLERLPEVPTVLINKRSLPRSRWSTVSSDHRHEACLAAGHLAAMGHSRVGLILDELEGWSAEQRISGYVETLRARWRTAFEPLVWSAQQLPVGDLARDIVRSRCTAIVHFSDNLGLSLLGQLGRGEGVAIPERLSVITLEHSGVSAHFTPPLTTVDQPLAELAEAAVTGVLKMGEGRGKRFDRILRSRLIERASVAQPFAGAK